MPRVSSSIYVNAGDFLCSPDSPHLRLLTVPVVTLLVARKAGT